MEPGHKMVTDLKLLPYRPNNSSQVNVFQSLMWQMFCNTCLFTAAFFFKALFQLGRTGLVVRASDCGSGDPGSILGRVGVLFP